MESKIDPVPEDSGLVERLVAGRKRHLLALKLGAPDRDTLIWELATARTLLEEYRFILDEAMKQRGQFAHTSDVLIELLQRAPDLIRSKDAQERARGRHANSTQAEQKRIAREWYDRWCTQSEMHATKEEFINCFLDVHPEVITDRTLRGWLTAWSKETGQKPWNRG